MLGRGHPRQTQGWGVGGGGRFQRGCPELEPRPLGCLSSIETNKLNFIKSLNKIWGTWRGGSVS